MTTRDPAVAVVGAGMSGLCVAIALLRNGIDDVTIYEKAHEVGGTWRENTYPGLSCDVPSRFYQYSFATNPDWTHLFSPGGEIQAYLCDVADRFALRDRIRFGTEIVSARFEDGRWVLRSDAGTQASVDFLISATGVLHHPRVPSIAGLDDFGGDVFHSARWDHGVRLRGRRIAVIGTGSTGIQLVCGLVDVAGTVMLFQRTAQWVLRLPNPRYSRFTRLTHRAVPWLDRLAYRVYGHMFETFAAAVTQPGLRRKLMGALCRAGLRKVRDPALRRALTPDYTPMCKRLVMSGGFYRAIQRDNAELVTAGIDHVERRGIVTADGVLHEADVIVLATGFDSHAFFRPMQLIGRDGIVAEDVWRDGPRAHQTVAMPGFPNFFMMLGPHSPVGNFALTAVAESQAEHILRWIQRWRRREFDTVEPTTAATETFNAELRAAMPNTVWTTGCDSWYLGKDGVPEVWPFTPAKHRAMLANPDPGHYHLRVRTAAG
ncbi:NAD(P)/FAD-dependent oxidoreductase [Mycobacterium shinjukuense]|uniref:Putative monooxygenase n=1 Tax=Mycobacterium shinjukuense TaxID=398694 RepID=A0A7I7MQZ2_9MYCO|nr:NAD(P)/FAD-dependent oxidoreductase [Mycobacterium shinjukuense]MCV6984268.1 NAD(P)/FAD-dependent oxidoreductase [Mycobacterium shinjukuense]ORB65865.1 monooxygenase [Mycobacterium shinjukuense]BBX74227.1 putative monooxygenase [Mycobacterium shinjukuense]